MEETAGPVARLQSTFAYMGHFDFLLIERVVEGNPGSPTLIAPNPFDGFDDTILGESRKASDAERPLVLTPNGRKPDDTCCSCSFC